MLVVRQTWTLAAGILAAVALFCCSAHFTYAQNLFSNSPRSSSPSLKGRYFNIQWDHDYKNISLIYLYNVYFSF